MKALFLDDGGFTKEKILEYKHMIDEIPNLTYDFAVDTNRRNYPPNTIPNYQQRLEKSGPEGWIVPDKEVLEKIADVDILFVSYSGITEEIIKAGKNLKLIYLMRSGAENVNVEAATRHGVSVCVAASRLKEPVADMTVALMLSECRGMV